MKKRADRPTRTALIFVQSITAKLG
jgi:hypothetical protein